MLTNRASGVCSMIFILFLYPRLFADARFCGVVGYIVVRFASHDDIVARCIEHIAQLQGYGQIYIFSTVPSAAVAPPSMPP